MSLSSGYGRAGSAPRDDLGGGAADGRRAASALWRLQAIMDAAGQRNKSAAQYHFGSRAGLIAQLLEVRMKPINDHRLRLLDDYDRLLPDAEPRTLVQALVVPLADEAL